MNIILNKLIEIKYNFGDLLIAEHSSTDAYILKATFGPFYN